MNSKKSGRSINDESMGGTQPVGVEAELQRPGLGVGRGEGVGGGLGYCRSRNDGGEREG